MYSDTLTPYDTCSKIWTSTIYSIRTFVRFERVWLCLFPSPLPVWDGLQLVNVALPGHFSYLFYYLLLSLKNAGRIANRVDPDQTPRSAASHLDLIIFH